MAGVIHPSHVWIKVNFFPEICIFLKGTVPQDFSTYYCGYKAECFCYILRFWRRFQLFFFSFSLIIFGVFVTNAWSYISLSNRKDIKILQSQQHCDVLLFFILRIRSYKLVAQSFKLYDIFFSLFFYSASLSGALICSKRSMLIVTICARWW